MTQGKLYLISCPLESQQIETALPAQVIKIASSLKYFIVENAKSARSFLKKLELVTALQNLQIVEFDKHNNDSELTKFLKPAFEGTDIGVLSETGSPGIADPGAGLVLAANKAGIQVVPLVGPSAVMLAILSSGLNGQNFAFNGYLPIKSDQLDTKIRELEMISKKNMQAQFFIETPYRLERLFSKLLQICNSQTLVSLALNVANPDSESCRTMSVKEWKSEKLDLADKLAVIGILA